MRLPMQGVSILWLYVFPYMPAEIGRGVYHQEVGEMQTGLHLLE
jgi:hypothetical protein